MSFLSALAKLRKAFLSFFVCGRQYGTTNSNPQDGFSWSLIFEDILKICLENSVFISYFAFNSFFLPQIVPLVRQCGKIWYSQTGHRWQNYNNSALRFASWITKAYRPSESVALIALDGNTGFETRLIVVLQYVASIFNYMIEQVCLSC